MEPEHAYGRAGREQFVMRRLSGESDDGALQGADYLEENVGATDVELSEDDLLRLAEAFPAGVAAGERYAPEQMDAVGR